MAIIVPDLEIAQYLDEPKILPGDYRKVVQTKPKRGHREQEICFDGQKGNQFKVVARISDVNPLDFSVIFTFIKPPNVINVLDLKRTLMRYPVASTLALSKRLTA